MIRGRKAIARQLLERLILGFWGAALLSLLLCVSVRAEVLHLATGDDYAPFTGKALPGQGMLTQVVRASLAEQGTAITLDWLPWNRGYLKAKRGDYDATFPYVRSAEREAEFLYSAPIYVAEQFVFSRADDHVELDDLPTMIGRRLCYPLGWQPPAAIQQLLDQGVLRRHSPLGLQECARLLLLKRDDLFIADRNLGDSALRTAGADPEQFHRSRTPFQSNTLHVIVSRQHPRAAELIERFNRGLEALKARGEYEQLIESYVQ
ncbi:polar amino acid transport system substrate-binding protein [Ectopseudomonas composti]|uniref:Polar amino acid transport system substrate-binding protein n=1 Tax=Ectopseudomonas composti TaxID=658457 RepID=A0A1I5S1C5_9GAMM|nr:polar amino acid transport system substrate-binding protein [Pseudomonas composti]